MSALKVMTAYKQPVTTAEGYAKAIELLTRAAGCSPAKSGPTTLSWLKRQADSVASISVMTGPFGPIGSQFCLMFCLKDGAGIVLYSGEWRGNDGEYLMADLAAALTEQAKTAPKLAAVWMTFLANRLKASL